MTLGDHLIHILHVRSLSLGSGYISKQTRQHSWIENTANHRPNISVSCLA